MNLQHQEDSILHGQDFQGEFSEKLSRRNLLRRSVVAGLSVTAIAGLLAACGDDDNDDEPAAVDSTAPMATDPTPQADVDETDPTDEPDADDPDLTDEPGADSRFGGTLRVAQDTTVTSLDPHFIRIAATAEITHHIYETLLALGEDYGIVPGLAEAWEWSEDGITLTLDLRENVLFHDGEVMIADDAVASIERYVEIGHRAAVAESVASASVIDEHTVEIEVQSADSGFLDILASPIVQLVVMRKEIIDGKGGGDLEREEFIGTGPYELLDWDPDTEVRVTRFNDYYASDGAMDGYGGAKVAYFDEIHYMIVPESGSRVSGLLSGEYDIIQRVPTADFDRLEASADVSPIVESPGQFSCVEFNHHPDSIWSANILFRQALQAAVNVEEIGAFITGGLEDFYDLNPSIYRRSQGAWWTDVAADTFNQADPDKARRLLDEAGYDGEEIIYLTEPVAHHRAIVLAMQEQLGAIGVNLTIQEMDRAATTAIVEQEPAAWHLHNGQFTMRFGPADWGGTLRCETQRRFWCNEDMEAAFDGAAQALEYDEQKEYSDEVQRVFHEDVFGIKLVDWFALNAYRNDIQGYSQWYLDRYWGIWREN